jgi:hypothetical protein
MSEKPLFPSFVVTAAPLLRSFTLVVIVRLASPIVEIVTGLPAPGRICVLAGESAPSVSFRHREDQILQILENSHKDTRLWAEMLPIEVLACAINRSNFESAFE